VNWSTFLGVERPEPGGTESWRLPVTDAITGGAGQLFGGCGLGAAVALLEELTGRPAAWATAQFLANAFPPEVVELEPTVVVDGRNFCQARVVGRVGDREILTVLAALGRKDFDGHGGWRTMPPAPQPEHCEPRHSFGPRPGGLHTRIEQRVAAGEWGDEHHSPSATTRVWMRLPDDLAGSTAGLAVVADFLPLGIQAALGREVFGTSLDNTIRYVRRATTPWVLADLLVDDLRDGVGHGTVHLWSEHGDLLAIASQTCGMREMTPPR
jgi:acyl-CoA thioesterase